MTLTTTWTTRLRARRGGPDWPHLTRGCVDTLALVDQLGPDVRSLTLVLEMRAKARARLQKSWLKYVFRSVTLDFLAELHGSVGTLYAHLNRLEECGYIRFRNVRVDEPHRKILLLYSITRAGQVRLEAERQLQAKDGSGTDHLSRVAST